MIKTPSEFLNKLSIVKIGNKTLKQKETIDFLEKCYPSREETINFLEIMEKWPLMQPTNQNKIKVSEKGLKY